MTVEIVTGSTPELVEAMGRLIPQLSRSAPALTAAECEALVAQNGVYLFIFRSDESPDGGVRPILGMLTLATFTIPTGLRAWVEDVVVDSAARGQGAGRALVEAALPRGREPPVPACRLPPARDQRLPLHRPVRTAPRPRAAAHHADESDRIAVRNSDVIDVVQTTSRLLLRPCPSGWGAHARHQKE